MTRHTPSLGRVRLVLYQVGPQFFTGRGCAMRALSAWIKRGSR